MLVYFFVYLNQAVSVQPVLVLDEAHEEPAGEGDHLLFAPVQDSWDIMFTSLKIATSKSTSTFINYKPFVVIKGQCHEMFTFNFVLSKKHIRAP